MNRLLPMLLPQLCDSATVPGVDHKVRITGFYRVDGRKVRCLPTVDGATHVGHYAICGGFARVSDVISHGPVQWPSWVILLELASRIYRCARSPWARDLAPHHFSSRVMIR
jgi:hypothetical protein